MTFPSVNSDLLMCLDVYICIPSGSPVTCWGIEGGGSQRGKLIILYVYAERTVPSMNSDHFMCLGPSLYIYIYIRMHIYIYIYIYGITPYRLIFTWRLRASASADMTFPSVKSDLLMCLGSSLSIYIYGCIYIYGITPYRFIFTCRLRASARAEMTFPSVNSDLLMCPVSEAIAPSDPESLSRSEPARSTSEMRPDPPPFVPVKREEIKSSVRNGRGYV